MAVQGSSSHRAATARRVSLRPRGFTLIEVMIVVAIVAILAAIALPNYSDYVKRGKIIEATSALGDARTRYEQYFLDNRTYAGLCTAGFKTLIQANSRAFTFDCGGESATTYAPTMTGNPAEGMPATFVYSINQDNVKSSNTPWGNQLTCWVTRKDGSCS